MESVEDLVVVVPWRFVWISGKLVSICPFEMHRLTRVAIQERVVANVIERLTVVRHDFHGIRERADRTMRFGVPHFTEHRRGSIDLTRYQNPTTAIFVPT